MNFNSYIISDTKTAITILQKCPPRPYSHKNFEPLRHIRKAFTLAEVLITLTIIGVVASMTIPTLMSKYQKQSYVVALKKTYSQLQNAIKMIPITEGCAAGDYDCAPITLVSLEKQFKLAKNGYNCNILGSYNQTCIQLQDGTIIDTAVQNHASMSTIGVDINGNKGPNKWGRDRFLFDIIDRKLVAVGSKLYSQGVGYWNSNPNSPHCTTEDVKRQHWNATYCAGRVLEEDAMNY